MDGTSLERVTEDARVVLRLARDEARLMGCDWIGTEHLLLALLRHRRGVANVVLDRHVFELDSLRRAVRLMLCWNGSPGEPPSLERLTNRAKAVLAFAENERKRLNHVYFATEHLLLALVAVRPSTAGTILDRAGLSHRTAEADLLKTLGYT